MPTLRDLLLKCEEDTKRIIGTAAAGRLASWRAYGSNEDRVSFIQRTIRVEANQANGFLIFSQGGLSLEAIVATKLPEYFTNEDISIAKRTLGIG